MAAGSVTPLGSSASSPDTDMRWLQMTNAASALQLFTGVWYVRLARQLAVDAIILTRRRLMEGARSAKLPFSIVAFAPQLFEDALDATSDMHLLTKSHVKSVARSFPIANCVVTPKLAFNVFLAFLRQVTAGNAFVMICDLIL